MGGPVNSPVMISVVTVVRNGASTIRACLDSVDRQDFPAEHIVVDGQSTDGTLEILNARAGGNRNVTSEPDQGMYDAMSKGILRATGDVIGVLNADDFYASSRVLGAVASAFEESTVDSCYGDLVYVRANSVNGVDQASRLNENNGNFALLDEKVVRRWTAGGTGEGDFRWGWMPPHPTFFVRRSVYEQFGFFRLDLGTAADYELMLRFLAKHRITTRYIPQVLVKMRVGGASNASLRNRLAANRYDRKAWAVNGLRPYPWTTWMKPLRKILQWT